MQSEGHLVLRERVIAPAAEWAASEAAWVFALVHEGDGYLLQRGKTSMLRSGELLVSPHCPLTRIRASQLGELHLHYFYVDPGQLTGVLSPHERQRLQATKHPVNAAARILPATHPTTRRFPRLNQTAATAPQTLATRCRLLELASSVLVEECPPAPPLNESLTAAQRLDEMMQRLTEAQLSQHSPADLAQLCGCSVRHFSRLFKARFGRSLMTVQIELRLQRARELLEKTDDKIIDIAYESGFQHVGLFTTMFGKRFHATPSAYRRRFRDSQTRRRRDRSTVRRGS